jgi:hypothetical protein
MACVGIYGVMAYMVAQRVQEMGVRLALGARRSDVVALVLRKGLLLAFWGIATGPGLLRDWVPLDFWTICSLKRAPPIHRSSLQWQRYS